MCKQAMKGPLAAGTNAVFFRFKLIAVLVDGGIGQMSIPEADQGHEIHNNTTFERGSDQTFRKRTGPIHDKMKMKPSKTVWHGAKTSIGSVTD